MIEAIETCQQIAGRELQWTYTEENRIGDHMWWISDVGKFAAHYPAWKLTYDVPRICQEIFEASASRSPEKVLR